MAAQTKAISNHCISEIKVPQNVGNACGVDYNPVLGLYATFGYLIVSVWNPVSGKVVAKFTDFGENFLDVLFVPGNRLAVSSSEVHHGGCIKIFNLGEVKSNEAEFVTDDEGNDREDEGNVKDNEEDEDDDKNNENDEDEDDDKDDEDDDDDDEEDEDDYEEDYQDSKVVLEIDDEDLPISYPGPMALSPSGNILIAEAFNGGGPSVIEIFIDWDNLKFLKWREILPGKFSTLLCCSRDFKVTMYSYKWPFLSSVKVCMNSEGEVHIQEQEKMTYYILNGEEKQIDKDVRALVHDGENLIIANKHDVVLLESMNEGSTAHLVASDVEPLGLRLNHEGQLIVCEKKAIKLFEYKCNPRSLQDLCRGRLRNFIQNSYTDKVYSLKIPYRLKKYLLFQ